MPNLPILVFPQARVASRRKRTGWGKKLVLPSAAEQKQRLDSHFQSVIKSLSEIQSDAQGLEPENVIVFEVAGADVENLAIAAAKIPGLEWLAECDLEDIEPVHGFHWAAEEGEEVDQSALMHCRLYALVTNQAAMNKLLSEWDRWALQPDKRARNNFGPFKQIFQHLLNVRRWGAQDRLSEGKILDFWREGVMDSSQTINFEIEFWYRQSPEIRNAAFEKVRQLLGDQGGVILQHAIIPEIHYHGALAQLPSSGIRNLLREWVRQVTPALFRCEDIMLFRPEAQAKFPISSEQSSSEIADSQIPAMTSLRDPIIGLLDGVPLVAHKLLDGRIVLDDPEDLVSKYQVKERRHGTAMASLILAGELDDTVQLLKRKIYLRPIFEPYTDFHGNSSERISKDCLLIDLIHSAIKRMKEGEDSHAAPGPNVKIVNLSLGNSFQPFERTISPLAKLIDWLAWKYNILFLISAGNQNQDIVISPSSISNDDNRRRATLNALHRDQSNRRLFSPAESVNALTIGALHCDKSSVVSSLGGRIDLLSSPYLPSPISTVCCGFRRSIKPDIFFPGGRQLYREGIVTGANSSFSISSSILPPGQKVAAPGSTPMSLKSTEYCCGTSNATALATHSAGLITEALERLRLEPGGERLSIDLLPVVVKTLLVHGASWGEAADILEADFSHHRMGAKEIKRLKSRFLGYGAANLEKSINCTDHRATMLGWDYIEQEKGHFYKIPLPPTLSGLGIRRRVTISLSWLTPINFQHSDYRRAELWIDFPASERSHLALDESCELDQASSRRGTTQHFVFEGDRAHPIIDQNHIEFSVNCREFAGSLEDRVPYCVAVTLEVSEGTGVAIYQEIKDRIRPRIPVIPTA